MGPTEEVAPAREARLELAVSTPARSRRASRVHLKLDTGMGRWGISRAAARRRASVVGLMSHLATADCDPDFTRAQIERFRGRRTRSRGLTRHLANSPASLRFPRPASTPSAAAIALYGLSPFGDRSRRRRARAGAPLAEPTLAQVKLCAPGESTGYGRRFVAERDTWIGIVPVGYADGFRRDLTGTEVLVDGERRRVVGTISMDAFAVELDRELPVGTPVTLLGDGLLLEEHARVAGTINYELACGIGASPAGRSGAVVDA